MDPKASESLPAFFLKEAGAKIKAGLCKGLTNLAFSDSTLRYFSDDDAGPKPVKVLQSRKC